MDSHSSKIFIWFQNILIIPKYSYGNGWKIPMVSFPMVSKIFLWLGKFLWFHSHGFENIPMVGKKSYGLENSYGFLKVLNVWKYSYGFKNVSFYFDVLQNDKFL